MLLKEILTENIFSIKNNDEYIGLCIKDYFKGSENYKRIENNGIITFLNEEFSKIGLMVKFNKIIELNKGINAYLKDDLLKAVKIDCCIFKTDKSTYNISENEIKNIVKITHENPTSREFKKYFKKFEYLKKILLKG